MSKSISIQTTLEAVILMKDCNDLHIILNNIPEIFLYFYSDEKSHARLYLNRTFYDERWSKNRCVTSFDWSTHHPELMVASYNNNEELPNEPDGVVAVWNTKYKKATPEDVFHCQSAVMSTCFAKFHPNLILGKKNYYLLMNYLNKLKFYFQVGHIRVKSYCGIIVFKKEHQFNEHHSAQLHTLILFTA